MSETKKIQIIIDSTTDLAEQYAGQVLTAPLIVSFGDTQYRDGVDLTRNVFYEKLESEDMYCPLPSSPSLLDDSQLHDQFLPIAHNLFPDIPYLQMSYDQHISLALSLAEPKGKSRQMAPCIMRPKP